MREAGGRPKKQDELNERVIKAPTGSRVLGFRKVDKKREEDHESSSLREASNEKSDFHEALTKPWVAPTSKEI